MHEYSIVRALLDRVEAEALSRKATAVRRVQVSIGELAGVEPELLETAFTLALEVPAPGGALLCRAAALEVRKVAARWACPDGHADIAPGSVLRCPVCARPARLLSGDEIMLERIEMEVA